MHQVQRRRGSPSTARGQPSLFGSARGIRIRPATVRDLETLRAHRRGMFVDMGVAPSRSLDGHDRRFIPWARARLRRGELFGLIAESRDGVPVASGCVWLREDQPRPWTERERSPYIMSIYTLPEWRRRGVANRIVRGLLRACRRQGYTMVRLNASRMGLSVYEGLGFERTTEMRRWLDPSRKRAYSSKRRG